MMFPYASLHPEKISLLLYTLGNFRLVLVYGDAQMRSRYVVLCDFYCCGLVFSSALLFRHCGMHGSISAIITAITAIPLIQTVYKISMKALL